MGTRTHGASSAATLCLIPVLLLLAFGAAVGAADIVAASADARSVVARGATVAVFMQGNDSLVTRVVEDALALALADLGFKPVSRELLEKTVGEYVLKTRRTDSETALDALSVAGAVGATLAVTGTIIVHADDEGALSIRLASVQLVGVERQQVVLQTLYEPVGPLSIRQLAEDFSRAVREQMS